MSQSLLQTMNSIVNVRDYKKDDTIPEIVLHDLYNAFRMGPSSISTQARELFIINTRQQCEKTIDSTLNPYMTNDSYGSQTWLLDAPFVSVVLIETRRAKARVGERGVSIAEQEAEAAIQNLRLIAHSHGLSTACVRELDPKMLRHKLDLPWYMKPTAVISAGYSDAELRVPPRLSLNDIVNRGGYGNE